MKTLTALFLASIISCILPAYAQNQKQPNIVIIYADDLGYGDLSSYGGDIPTPNIDRIGKEGIRFTNFYVAAPVCTPSRFGLLTGMYPIRSKEKLYTALMPLDTNALDKSEKIIPAYLKNLQYQTALFGKWHLGKGKEDSPLQHGFDYFSGFTGGCIDFFDHVYGSMGDDWQVNGQPAQEEGYSTDLITQHAINFLDHIKNDKKPFFLYLPYNAPHYGKTDPDHVPDNTVVLKEEVYEGYKIANTLQAPEHYYKRFEHIKDPYRKAYAAMVASLDDNVGKLLQKMESIGLLDNTIIWFISDNGGYSESYFGHASNGGLRGQKGTLYEGGIRVPGMVLWKNKIKPNQVIHTPVANIDLLPTFASILNFSNALPSSTDGIDISPILFRKNTLERDLYWNYGKQSALRSGDWKLVNGKELYNLKEDQNEKVNLAKKYPEKVKELQKKFLVIDSNVK
jgi:arylsulfatase A-like enzyme